VGVDAVRGDSMEMAIGVVVGPGIGGFMEQEAKTSMA
jgi:hypothetical protein